MDSFVYQYPVKQYFGNGCAEEAIKKESKTIGRNVLLTYGSGSPVRMELYDKTANVVGRGRQAGNGFRNHAWFATKQFSQDEISEILKGQA